MQLAADVNAVGTAFLALRGLLTAFLATEIVVALVLAAKGFRCCRYIDSCMFTMLPGKQCKGLRLFSWIFNSYYEICVILCAILD